MYTFLYRFLLFTVAHYACHSTKINQNLGCHSIGELIYFCVGFLVGAWGFLLLFFTFYFLAFLLDKCFQVFQRVLWEHMLQAVAESISALFSIRFLFPMAGILFVAM